MGYRNKITSSSIIRLCERSEANQSAVLRTLVCFAMLATTGKSEVLKLTNPDTEQQQLTPLFSAPAVQQASPAY